MSLRPTSSHLIWFFEPTNMVQYKWIWSSFDFENIFTGLWLFNQNLRLTSLLKIKILFFVWHFQYQNDIWTVSSARGYISMVLCRARKILKVLKYFLLWYTATLETIAAAGTKAIVTNLRIIAQKYIWYCLENVW